MLVKQVRIPVLLNDNSQNGEVVELCAGLVDKDKSIEQIVKEEVEEEIGYNVPLKQIKFNKTLKSSVGTSGCEAHTYLCEVTESMKVSEGGGLESEDIEVIRIPYSEVSEYFEQDIHTDAITMYIVNLWQMKNIIKKFNHHEN